MFLDDKLLKSLYPGETMLSLSVIASGDFVKRMVLDMVLMTLYIGLPLLWSGLMAAAGISIGNALGDIKRTALGPVATAGKTATAFPAMALSAGLSKVRALSRTKK